MYKCQDCNFSTNWSCSLKRHEKGVHNEGELNQIYNNTLLYKCQDCTFSSNWLSNLKRREQRMRQNYIMNTVYSNNSRSHGNGMHKEDEMLSLEVNFKEGYGNIVNVIKFSVPGEPTLIIFDDLI